MMKAVNQCVSMLRHSSLTKYDRARLRPIMENWLKAHAYLKRFEAHDSAAPLMATEVQPVVPHVQKYIEELQRMLELELTDRAMRPRWHMLEGLHNRLCTWRKVLDKEEMAQWLAAQKKAASKGI